MRASVTRVFLAAAVIAVGAVAAANASVVTYATTLSGPNESPPNASPGSGTATLDYDNVAHTIHMHVVFGGLIGTTTASHTHAPTAVAGVGTASVATTTPYFAGFPIGVSAGTYDITMSALASSSWNASYITANGGTPAGAEAAFFTAIGAGKAYLNIHSSAFGGGEIRGFWTAATPSKPTTWGRIKSLYK